jgi:CheY-like chemotaxis protein
MSQVLLVDDDLETLITLEKILRSTGHSVVVASSGAQCMQIIAQQKPDVVIVDYRLPDISGIDILCSIRRGSRLMPMVIVTGFVGVGEAVAAMRLGAADFIEKPISEDNLRHAIARALAAADGSNRPEGSSDIGADQTAHAAARWARAVAPIVDSPKDIRTIPDWGRWIAASAGALRNWCRTAGITPRRSLIFARVLRAVCLDKGGPCKPANMLDVVDLRTLDSLLRFAGFAGKDDFPRDVQDFLDRQVLVHDQDAVSELIRAIEQRHRQRLSSVDSDRNGRDDVRDHTSKSHTQ